MSRANFLLVLLLVFTPTKTEFDDSCSSPTNVTHEDLVHVSTDIIARIGLDIEEIHRVQSPWKEKLLHLQERNNSIVAEINQNVVKMNAIMKVRDQLNNALDFTKVDDREEIHRNKSFCIKMKVTESSDTSFLAKDALQALKDIARLDDERMGIVMEINLVETVIAPYDLQIMRKMVIIEALTRLYDLQLPDF